MVRSINLNKYLKWSSWILLLGIRISEFHFSSLYVKNFLFGDICFSIGQKMSKGNFPEQIAFFIVNFFNKIYEKVPGCLSKFWGLFRTSSQSEFIISNVLLPNSYNCWSSPVSRWLVSTTLLWTNCAILLQILLHCSDLFDLKFLMETKHAITQSCYSHLVIFLITITPSRSAKEN